MDPKSPKLNIDALYDIAPPHLKGELPKIINSCGRQLESK